MLNLPPRNGYRPIMNIISIQARHTAAEATTFRTSWTWSFNRYTYFLTVPYQILHEKHSSEGQGNDTKFEPALEFSEVSPSQCEVIPELLQKKNAEGLARSTHLVMLTWWIPERDHQKYLHGAECRVRKGLMRGATSEEPGASVIGLLWHSGQFGVGLSDGKGTM